jgi:transposase InsO family protein
MRQWSCSKEGPARHRRGPRLQGSGPSASGRHVAFASLSVQKRPEQAAALLHEEALPFYQYMELPVGELLTGSGSDYGGSGKLAHPFSLYAALHGIPQRLAEGQAAHANGYMERFKFFRRSDSSAAYDLLESLQLEFADWLAAYNTERPHYGYPNDGKPPLERITSYLAQRPQAH